MQQAGIGDEFHPGGFGGVYHVLVLYGTLAHFAGGDEQQFIHAVQRGGKCGFIGVIRLTHNDPLLTQRFGFRQVTHNSHDLAGRNGFQQFFNNVLAKLAGCAGNRDHDESPSCLSGVVAHYHHN